MIGYKNYKSVRVFVKSPDGILICKREDNGIWELPGGAVEKGESVLDGAKRELFEETGIRAKGAKLVGDWKIRNITAAVVVCSHFTGKFKTSFETTDIVWINNFENDKRVRIYTKEVIREIQKEQEFFSLESKRFEVTLVVRYIYGKIKRMLRKQLQKVIKSNII